MKAIDKLAILLSLGALAPFASAKTLEQTYLDSYPKAPGVPMPISVVSPNVGSNFQGETVEIEFTVDTAGKPSHFLVKSCFGRQPGGIGRGRGEEVGVRSRDEGRCAGDDHGRSAGPHRT